MTASPAGRLPLDGSLFPNGLAWRPVPPALAERLQSVFANSRIEAAGGAGAAFRHLRGEDPAGRRLFCTLIRNADLADAQAADASAVLAARAGVETAAVLGKHAMADGKVLLLRPWLEGAHPPLAIPNFYRLGETIALLHRGLSALDVVVLDAATNRRLELLATACGVERWQAVGDCTDLAGLAGDWAELAHIARRDAVACHGDLHAGNMIVKEDGRVAIVDFEETSHSFFNPACDLARAFERAALVMSDVRGVAWVVDAGRALLAGYRNRSGWTGRLIPFGTALAFHRALAARTCLSLGDPEDAGWRCEMRKQLRLAELAAEHASLLQSLQA